MKKQKINRLCKFSTKVLLLWMPITLTIGTMGSKAETEINKEQESKETENSITEAKLNEMIKYFYVTENSDDEENIQSFPWRGFRKMIESIQTQNQAQWLIKSLPNWPDGQDQESLSLMASKIGELAGPEEIEMLLTWVKSPIPTENKLWALESISRSSSNANSEKLKSIIEDSANWVGTEETLKNSPPKAASEALCKSKDYKNINYVLEILESNSKNGTPEAILKNKAAKYGIISLK